MNVSIVIPAYNEEKFLPNCLESILKQDEKPDEIIVVDNNSTDKTVEIAKTFPVKLMHEPKQGIIASRNTGLNAASYEIIARIDADTILPSGWIKRLKQDFADPSIIAVSGPVLAYDRIKSPIMKKFFQWLHTTLFFRLTKLTLGHESLFGSNMAIRKELWEKIKSAVCLQDHAVHEDMDIAVHLIPYGKILYDPQLLAFISYRRTKSLSSLFEYTIRWWKTVWHAKTIKPSSDAYTSSPSPKA